MKTLKNNAIIEALSKSLDIPDSAYQAAETRYKSLSTWLSDPNKALTASYSPHVFPQGSFRLGTVNKPLDREDDFDLDLSCNLKSGLDETQISQKDLKDLFQKDLAKYCSEKGIQSPLEEKRRCWRLNYQDQTSFHIDAVPAIPASMEKRATLQERMINFGQNEHLANSASSSALSITDNEDRSYKAIPGQWHSSNPEGYALWFEEQMKKNEVILENFSKSAAQVDPLPTYRYKSTLQRCVQILKRHRDLMYKQKDQDSKPISIIITTIAARAYKGESDLTESLSTILEEMENHIGTTAPKVPNPVNPKEDFADKWDTAEGRQLRLEHHFKKWLKQAKADFGVFSNTTDKLLLETTASRAFATSISESVFSKQAGTNRLKERASLVNSRTAHTSAAGVIGAVGTKNQNHNFYGE